MDITAMTFVGQMGPMQASIIPRSGIPVARHIRFSIF